MSLLLHLRLLIFLFFVNTFGLASPADTTCSSLAAPIAIPLTNVTLANNLLSRGAYVSIGSPPQTLAFAPNPAWNNTYVFDAATGGCGDDATPNGCSLSRGGFFDEGRSTTYSQARSMFVLGTAQEHIPDHNDDVFGNDTLRTNSTLSLPNFPFGRNRDTVDNQNALGLGRNSTLLNALLAKGAISSRSYALWQGWTGAEASQQMDGILTLGGYDAAKVAGNDNVTLPFSDNIFCSGLVVTVSDIQMNLKNGSNISIMGPSAASAIQACLSPGYPLVSLSEDIWNGFVNVSGVSAAEKDRSTGVNFWGMLINARGAYDGDLSFSLSPGLTIRIPNHQLVVPNYVSGQNGARMIENGTTVREVLINSLQDVNKNDMPILGRPFLTSAYLIVDIDHRQFTVAPAKATDTQDIVAIGPPACSSAEQLSTPTAGIPATSQATALASTTPDPKSTTAASRQDVPIAAIAGGACGGGVVAIALCLAAILALRRRRRRARERAIQESLENAKSGMGVHVLEKGELASDHTHQPPMELPLERDPQYRLAPFEMPGARDTNTRPQSPVYQLE